MRTSPSGISNNGSNGNSFSPSKSSSTCSSPSPSSPVISTPSARKFMEEVWKDISLASLHERSNKTRSSTITTINTTTENPEFCGTSLQDFFTRPLNKDPAKRGASSGATDPSLAVETTFLYTPVPPPTTMLSLNSGSDFAYLESRDPIGPNSQSQWRASFTTPPFVYSLNSAFDVSGSSAAFPSCCKKRAQENDDNSCDRRHKRMIKNRESAARSRARKQEYFFLFSSFYPFLCLEHLKHSSG
ncbi:Protein FD [Morella rubra]|uniref:Protein FD n=1 Tax=Morella rubra TaxID=262757 RepID=A0A6A1UV96_9ROSI|nr:Protein FD [Morella rubra]